MNKLLGKLGKFLLIYVLVFTQSFTSIAIAKEEAGGVPDRTTKPVTLDSFNLNAAQIAELRARCQNKTITEIQAEENPNFKIICDVLLAELKQTKNSTGDTDCVDCDTKMAQPKNNLGLAQTNLGDLSKVTGQTNAEGSKAVCSNKTQSASQCVGDVMCALIPTGCPKYQGNGCILTLFQGIFQSLKGTWDGLKFIGKAIYSGTKSGIKWVGNKIGSWFSSDDQKKLENEAANRAHVVAQAKKSEIDLEKQKKGEGFLAMVKRMASQIWDGIWKSAQETFACEKWSGAPQVSKCLEHSASFECANCFQKTNLICGVGGYILSDILIASTGMGLAVNAASYAPKALAKIPGMMKLVNGLKAGGSAMGRGAKALGGAVTKPGKMLVGTINKGAANGSKVAKAAQLTGDGVKLLASAGIKIVGTVAKVPLKVLQFIANIPGIKQYINWSDKAFSWGRNLRFGKKVEQAFHAGSTLEMKLGSKIDEATDVVIHSPGKEAEIVKGGIEDVGELSKTAKAEAGAVSEGRTIEGAVEVADEVPFKLSNEQFMTLKNDKEFSPLIKKFETLEDQKMVAEIIDQVRSPNYVSPTKGKKLTSSKEVVEEVDNLIRKACPIKK